MRHHDYSPRSIILALLLLSELSCGRISLAAGDKADFSRQSIFTSLQDFVTRASHFKPGENPGYMGYLFASPEQGQPEDPATGRMVVADTIDKAVVVWQNPDRAAIFISANPKTEATHSTVGALMLLSKVGPGQWRISAIKTWQASGLDCAVDCKLTAEARPSDALGSEASPVVLTVTAIQGGRGYSFSTSSSYQILGDKIRECESP